MDLTASKIAAVLITLLFAGTGCVTVGDFRREMDGLETRMKREQVSRGGDGLADVSSRLDEMAGVLRKLQGRVEVAEKMAREARDDARRAREELARQSAAAGESEESSDEAEDDAAAGAAGGETDSAELIAYRAAYGAWRDGKHDECVDLFRDFLQAYPASGKADDAAFWMADCHFKQGDYKNAVLRFDDVVRNYPDGNKAPDALYRQGESLLRLGPGFHEAAKRAFERVKTEYPDTARAKEADRQIELLAKG